VNHLAKGYAKKQQRLEHAHNYRNHRSGSSINHRIPGMALNIGITRNTRISPVEYFRS